MGTSDVDRSFSLLHRRFAIDWRFHLRHSFLDQIRVIPVCLLLLSTFGFTLHWILLLPGSVRVQHTLAVTWKRLCDSLIFWNGF